MKRVFICMSGAATRIAFLAGCTLALLDKIKLNGITKVVGYSGISSGGILAAFFAMGNRKAVEMFMPIYSLEMIFGVKPDSFKGKFSLVKNILKGKYYLYKFKGLLKILKEEITQKDLDEYIKSDNPPAYLGVVDFETGEELYYNIKEIENVRDVHKLILATSSIPVYVPYQEVFGRKLYDGGLRSHIGSAYVLKEHYREFDEIITIYSRSNNLKDYVYNFKSSFMSVLGRSLEILNLEVSKNDEAETDKLAKSKGKKVYKMFAPKKLQSNTFEASKEGNLEMLELGKEVGSKWQ